jgi:hypothetical protein
MIVRGALILLCTLTLVGCAKVGTLDRPAPLFGEKAKARYQADKAAAAAKAQKPDSGEPEPLPASGMAPSQPAASGADSSEAPPAPPALPPVAPQ